ncbi:hypothetical protein [Mesorhizobium sp. ORS 3428]|uniref:hypothetical protein n=1 Tax=Mesorhizobium sp. ORS 3428 TaxID=540997 RepID=UPI001041CAAD|nr:hypothetical protein [Mesorhizobium sp. ORS 3428]
MSSIVWRSLPVLHVLALVLASCSSSETVEQSRRGASTAESAKLVTDVWLSGAAPSHYASAGLQLFGRTLVDARRRVESSSSSEIAKRDTMGTAVSRLFNAASRAESAFQAGQPVQANQARQELRAAQADLATAYRDYFTPQR